MFRAAVTQVVLLVQTEEDPGGTGQAGFADLDRISPARRSIGCDQPGLTWTPYRHADGDDRSGQAACTSDGPAMRKDAGCVGVVGEPPFEQAPGVVDGRAESIESRCTEA